jgi:hypothetical protein
MLDAPNGNLIAKSYTASPTAAKLHSPRKPSCLKPRQNIQKHMGLGPGGMLLLMRGNQRIMVINIPWYL